MTKKISRWGNFRCFYFYFFLFFFSIKGFTQCPTVSNSNQTFCNTQSPTVSNLVATNNGGGIVWYATAVSSLPLSANTPLVNGEDYFADSTTGCGSREQVIVTIYSAPTGQNFQGVCVENASQATINSLVAIGNNIQWYTAPSGGTALTNSSVLTDNTIYYASQTNPNTGCQTSRLSVFVNVGIVPVPTGDANQFFCNNPSNPPTVSSLNASGNNNWYDSPTSVVPLDLSTPLVSGQSYFATTVDPPCESANRLEVVATLMEPNNSGSNGNVTICSSQISGNPIRNLFSYLGGTPQTNGVWSGPLNTINGYMGTINISSLTAVGSPYIFSYTVSNLVCASSTSTVIINITQEQAPTFTALGPYCQNATPGVLPTTSNNVITGTWSPSVISTSTPGTQTYTFTPSSSGCYAIANMNITVNLLPNAGTNGVLNICSNAIPQNLFASLGGTPQTGGVWSPALASGTGIFNPSVDSDGIYTYTVTGISPCGNATATVTVTKTQAPNPGTNATLNLCINSSNADLFTSLGGTPQSGGTWSPALSSGTGIFNPSTDVSGLYTYTLASSGPCPSQSALVNVVVNQLPNAGSNGVLNICSNAIPQNLFASLGGTPQTGGVWSPALASGTGIFNPAVDSDGVYIYTVTGISPCGNATATVTVTKTQAPNPGVGGSLNICSNVISQDLFVSLGGTPQTGGLWTPSLSSGTGVFNPALDVAGVYTYTMSGISPCSNASSTITVSIAQAPNAGTDGVITICSNGKPKDLFLSLGGSPQSGGTWSPALNSGSGIFNPAVDTAGIYTYTVSSSSACVPGQATVNVTVDTTCPAIEIIAPDGFSPNGDTINDEFVIQNLPDLYPNFSIKIYNRYGNVLYEGNINTPNWNGKATQGMTVGDGLVPTGVYFYVIEFNDGVRKPFQGRVYLSR